MPPPPLLLPLPPPPPPPLPSPPSSSSSSSLLSTSSSCVVVVVVVVFAGVNVVASIDVAMVVVVVAVTTVVVVVVVVVFVGNSLLGLTRRALQVTPDGLAMNRRCYKKTKRTSFQRGKRQEERGNRNKSNNALFRTSTTTKGRLGETSCWNQQVLHWNQSPSTHRVGHVDSLQFYMSGTPLAL